MVKEKSTLADHLPHTKRVLHQQKNIDVRRVSLGRNERPEHHEPRDLACSHCDRMNSFKSLRHSDPLL
jgi:hypothetical protein